MLCKYQYAFVFSLMLALSQLPPTVYGEPEECCECDDSSSWGWAAVLVTVVAAPYVAPFLGFTAAGIQAGSWAAKGMSLAYKAGYGAKAVATMQSVGAAGLTTKTAAVIGKTAYHAGSTAAKGRCCKCH